MYEVVIFSFALKSYGWGGNELVGGSIGYLCCEYFEWGYVRYFIATLHSMLIVLLSLGIKGDSFCRGDFGFLPFVKECFA